MSFIETDTSVDNSFISVSTSFYPGAHDEHTNTILLSSDCVFFYIRADRVLAVSNNDFHGLLHLPVKDREQDPVVTVAESSPVINIILHAVYDLDCSHYSPPFDDLSAAVDAFAKYGLSTVPYLRKGSPMFALILSHAPVLPLEVYALAAAHNAQDLAVACSPHLLSLSLPALTDELASRIGPIYLKRLFFLHLGRSDALKRLLLPPPLPHPPTPTCDFVEQKKLTRAWALASAYLTWDTRPDLSIGTIEAALHPLGEHLTCAPCKETLNERIRKLIVEWSVVKRTI